jgi:putative peptidoglycan lipid II flippase
MSRFARSTATVTLLTAAGLGLGFWSQVLIAARFGAGPGMDAYLVAGTLPNLLTNILTTSLAACFLPVYAEWRERDAAEAWRIAGAFTVLVGLFGVALCLAGMALSEPIVRLVAPGMDETGVMEASSMQRWLLPVVLLASVNQILSGLRYAEDRFAAPLLIRVTTPLLTVASVLAFSASLDVRSLVLATLCAHVLQTALLAPGLLRGGRAWDGATAAWRHPATRKALRMAAPLAAAMCLYKLGPAYERRLASEMGDGAIATLGYATRLIQALQPLLISGVALSGFALLSRLVPRGDREGVRAALEKACGALFFVGVPLAALLAGFAEPVIGYAFERGAFTRADTVAVAPLFALYALALPAGAVGTVVGQAYYAFQNTRQPIVAGFLDIALFVALATALAPRLGLIALPLSYLVSFHVTALWIAKRLDRETGFPVLPLLARPFGRALAAAAVALGAGLLLQRFFAASYRDAILCLIAGAALYPLVQHFVFRSPETARAVRMLGGLLSRRSDVP